MTTMVDYRKVRRQVRKAPLAVLVELHRELAMYPADELYQQTVAELGFDPIENNTQDVMDMVHGPFYGPYQESLTIPPIVDSVSDQYEVLIGNIIESYEKAREQKG